MKTYEIKMNRSRWFCVCIFILCIAMIIAMLNPYFQYGKETSTYTTGDDKVMLAGKTWVINGKAETDEGYRKIVIDDDGKTGTVYVSNTLRVNQINALANFKTAIDNYNEIAQAYEKSRVYADDAQAKFDEFNELYTELTTKTLTEGDDSSIVKVEWQAVAADSSELTQKQKDLAEVEKQQKIAARNNDTAKKALADAEAALNDAKTALDQTFAAAKQAYETDASTAWVRESKSAYDAALKETYPDEYLAAYANVLDDEFKKYVSDKYYDEYLKFVDEKKALNTLVSNLKKDKAAYTAALEGFLAQKPGLKENDVIVKLVNAVYTAALGDDTVGYEKYYCMDQNYASFASFTANKYASKYEPFKSRDNAKENLYTIKMIELTNDEKTALYADFAARYDIGSDAQVALNILNSYYAANKQQMAADFYDAEDNLIKSVKTLDEALAILPEAKDDLLTVLEEIKTADAAGYNLALVNLYPDEFKTMLTEVYADDYAKLNADDLAANDYAKAKSNYLEYELLTRNDKKQQELYELYIKENPVNTVEKQVALMQAMGTDCSWYKDGKVDGEALKAAYPDDYKVQYSEVNLDDFKAYLKTTYPDLYKAAATDKSGQKNALTNFASNRKTTLNKTDLNALYTEFMEKNGALDPKDKAPAAIDNMLEIIAGEMSAEDRDNAIYGNLAQHKDESAAAASASAAAASLSASALKSGSQKATSDKSAKAVTAIDGCIQALAKIKDSYAKAASAATTETEDAAASAKTYEDVRRYSISDEELLIDSKTLDAIEKEASDEGALMEIPVKVALSNKGKLTLKYTDEASGKDWKTDETDFAVSFKYDSVKTLSILGFVAFPNDYTEFTSGTLEYKIKNYFINDVVLVPILLLLLCVAGAVLAIVFRDSFASGICPAAAGIVGLIAYLSSSFLKLGMKGARTTHIIICVLLLIAGCLQLYLGIEEKRKAAKNA